MRFLFYVLKKYSIPIVQPIIKHLQQTDFIAQCFIFPDEGEVEAIVGAALRVLTGAEKTKIY
jgi:butyrate kinase